MSMVRRARVAACHPNAFEGRISRSSLQVPSLVLHMEAGAKGAMAKSFSGSSYLEDPKNWMDLIGPAGLGGGRRPGRTIYGGSAEILRSLVAEVELRLQKSR